MRILVTGSRGRLGSALVTGLHSAGHRVTGLAHSELDITDPAHVLAAAADLRPQAIVNCGAYNAVDAAEHEPEAAFAVNARGPGHLARAARKRRAILVHFSTDYVFDGASSTPYVEEIAANPLSVYGASKAAGDLEAAAAPRHYILRLESLFGGEGISGHLATVDYMAQRIRCGQTVRAIADRTVTPSYVPDVVQATQALLERKAPYGTYHCVNSGCTTWLSLAEVLARLLACPASIEPVLSTHVQSVARRPRLCALSNAKLRAAGIAMPTWQSALRRHLMARSTPAGSSPPADTPQAS